VTLCSFPYFTASAPPPIVHEILPTHGATGSRAAILGTNFVNSPNLKVKFADFDVPCNFHEQGTLIISVPSLPRSGKFPVKVSNDGVNYCETKVFFNYMQTS
jgi:hypothetical protein